MKAVVYKGPFEVAVEDVDDPVIQDPTDVIVKITSTAICGSDLHMYEGRTDAKPGITFGHENMGIVEEIGSASPPSTLVTGWSCHSMLPVVFAITAEPVTPPSV